MNKKRLTSLILAATLLNALPFSTGQAAEAAANAAEVKNIIYMIPDGGAMASFYLADAVKQAGGLTGTYPNATPVDVGEMYIKEYLVGAETTYSASSSVTDSAAAGTALSSGYKTNNGYLGVTPDKIPRANILEASQAAGKNTGIVVTYEWTNATPAAFGSHSESRQNTLEIGEQMVNQGIDVVFGNTLSTYEKQEWFTDEAFESRGYEVITTKEQLDSIQPGDRVWGKLPAAYYDIDRAADTPNLAQLTTAAIKALDDGNENGFFLMVEGSAVDGGGHSSNALQMVSEFLAFDEACKVAIEYAKEAGDTLVVILPDHDTGGLTYGSTYTSSSLEPLVADIMAGVDPDTITWEGNGGHTARDGGIFMYVPDGVAYPEGIDKAQAADVAKAFEADVRTSAVNRVNNTIIAPYLADFIGVDLDALTNELFVDVTSQGTYNEATEEFTLEAFSEHEIVIEKDASYANIDGEKFDLDGQVAVYLDGKFYVPKALLDEVAARDVEGISIHADYNSKTVTVTGTTNKAGKTITLIAAKPGKEVAESAENNELAYIAQVESDANREYTVEFTVEDAQVGDYSYVTRISDARGAEEYSFSFKNMTIKKDGTVVEHMSQLAEGDTIDLVLNGYDSSYDGNAIIAQYDANGVLVKVDYVPVTGAAVNYEDESKISTTVQQGVTVIKGFYWAKSTNMPFTGTYIVD